MNESSRVYELRQYTLHSGRRDELISLFEREFIEPQNRCGMWIDGLFRCPERPDVFVWMRSFPDMPARKAALESFYGGPVWNAHRNAANATMIDSNNVLLLKSRPGFVASETRGALYCAIYLFSDRERLAEFDRSFGAVAERLAADGVGLVGRFVTDESPNTFPALPLREGEFACVVFFDGGDPNGLQATHPSDLFELVPTERSNVRVRFSGAPNDFAFLSGEWRVKHRILRSRLRESNDWVESDGAATAHCALDGMVSTDEITVGDGLKGCSFRHLDLARQRWSIYWVNNRTGELLPPVSGGFREGRGEFYGYDCDDGTPVLARYIWLTHDADHPRWEQAFSIDGGREWETNWVMEFSREEETAPASGRSSGDV